MDSCPACGTAYGKRRRCYKCKPANERTGETRTCEIDGKSFYVPRLQLEDPRFQGGRFCSTACKAESQRRNVRPVDERRPYVNKQGYVMVPVASGREQQNYRAEHRVVMERILGRRLLPSEQVHHIDGNRQNNDPSNLQVLGNADHQRLHDWSVTKSQRVKLTCKRCGKEYERKRSKVAESNYCSAAHRLEAQHEAARTYWAKRRKEN